MSEGTPKSAPVATPWPHVRQSLSISPQLSKCLKFKVVWGDQTDQVI